MWFFTRILGSTVFASMLSRIVFVILGSLGIGYASFSGIDLLIDGLLTNLESQKSSISATVAQFLHLIGFDTAINILFSSSAAILLLKGVVGGKLTKFVTSGVK